MRPFVLAVSMLLCCGSTLAQNTGPVTLKVPMADYGFHVKMSAGGAAAHTMQVDTGSTGIVVGYPHIGGKPQPLTPQDMARYGLTSNYVFYNSSGNVSVGRWVFTSVVISDNSGNSVTVDRIPVLSVDHMCKMPPGTTTPTQECLNARPWKVDCSLPPRKRDRNTKALCDLGMMGVGFDRGTSMGNAGVNPFLHTRQMVAGTVRRGYIVSAAGGITLGLTPTNVAGFRFVPLQRLSGGGPFDWQQASGCVSAAGGGIANPGPPVCGRILMDTGVDRMFLSYAKGFPAFKPPLAKSMADLWNCPPTNSGPRPCTINAGANSASVTVTWPSTTPPPPFRYAVQAPRQFVANGAAPSNVHMRQVAQLPGAGGNVFVNTSRQLLYTADYLYDASAGRIGFRPLPPR